jgi:hypothetical protein
VGAAAPVVVDLGEILAREQVIEHRFRYVNPTDRVVKLLGFESVLPCCSAVGAVPETVGPGQAVELPVQFRPGLAMGPREVGFVLRTDQADAPDRAFALRAELLPAFEIQPIREDQAVDLRLGETGRRAYRVICRQTPAGEGMSLPDQVVDPSGRLRVSALGERTLREGSSGLREGVMEIEVELPGARAPGLQRGELRLLWPGGGERTHPLVWGVRASVVVEPPGLVLREGGVLSRELVIRSVEPGRVFRVLGVGGEVLAEPAVFSVAPAERHVLKVLMDGGRTRSRLATDLVIRTDVEEQPELRVPVMTLGRGGSDTARAGEVGP